jgi:flagellar hook-length control protein FliK
MLAPASDAAAAQRGVLATVLEKLANSMYRVEVAGQTYRIPLPDLPSLVVGDQLLLQSDGAEELATEAGGNVLGALEPETAASAVATAANSAPAATANPSASTRLSEVAVWVARALNDTPSGTPAAVRGAVPLLPAPTPHAAEIGQAVQHAIAKSGLFYESHVAAWAIQRYPQQALAHEPQAHAAAIMNAMRATALPAAMVDAPATDATTLSTPAPHADITTQALPPLVREQLHALEARSLIWQGELWPGQPASIEIAEDDRRHASQQEPDTAAPAWRARLRLALPQLGGIDMSLALDADRLRVLIGSEQAGTASALRTALPDLTNVMQRRQLVVDSIEIKHEPAGR